jgi:hypothetical protein
MWWVPAGTIPTIGEAKKKLEQLEAVGPQPDAFTFQDAFDANGAAMALPRLFRHDAG